jgi:hypothetical protein
MIAPNTRAPRNPAGRMELTMRFGKRLLPCLLMAVLVTALFAQAEQKPLKIEGYVLDSACAFIRNVKKPMNAGKCATECAKAGSPLIILADDGTIYWPISDAMPAVGQNSRLMEFAGKHVSVTAKAHYERSGSHAVVIDKIEAKPESQ